MSGLITLRARAEALRWAADQVEDCDPVDAAGFLRGLAGATEAALAIVSPDYGEEPPPAEAEQAEEPEEPDADEPLAEELAALTESEPSSIACELPRAAPAAPPRAFAINAPAEPPRRFARWTEDQIEELRRAVRTLPKAEAVRLIADRYGFTTQRVYDKIKDDPTLRGPARAVRLTSPVERQLAEEAASAEVADADIGTIRAWLAANGGGPVPDGLTLELIAAQANELRLRLGLPAFRLVRHPIGAIPQPELARMAKAGEVAA
ncbi:hypothetical protein [Elioraea sp.]|uniref:hypothetical protein n=1 Tax=Elioraea sp. TaxID=2185103 RepID=UPI0025C2F9C3|nr:hypothetical protein [Elioraea sp.]